MVQDFLQHIVAQQNKCNDWLVLVVQGRYIMRDGKKVLVLAPHIMQQYKEIRLNLIVKGTFTDFAFGRVFGTVSSSVIRGT